MNLLNHLARVREPRVSGLVMVLVALTQLAGVARADRPQPIGQSTITVMYETAGGMEMYSGSRNYTGTGPVSATNLGSAPNIAAFNSANEFGRRMNVSRSPLYPHVLHPNETAITHAFFKKAGNEDAEFFPGIMEDGHVMISVENIQFDRAVAVDMDTLLLHTLWNDQNDMQDMPYHHMHNLHTATEPFRELDDFLAFGEFVNHPAPNYLLANPDIEWSVMGNGTDTLSIMASVPYHALRNLEDLHHHGDRGIPDGLPAPHGFLEPFHFHIEYTVTPEPATLALLLVGGGWLLRRRGAVG